MVASPLVTLPVTIAISCLVVIALLCALLIPVNREYRARGYVEPIAGLVEVPSPATGAVSSILVSEGTKVRAGDRLLTLDTSGRLAEGGSLEKSLIGTTHESGALLDERARMLAAGHREARSELTDKLASLIGDRRSLVEIVALKRRRAAALSGQIERYQGLVDKGFGSELELQRRQSELLSAQQDILESEMRLTSLDRDIKALRGEIAREQTSLDLQVNEIRQRRVGTEAELVRAEAQQGASILAPIAGTIGHLPVKLGQVVPQSMPLISIVPQGGFQVRLLIPARSAGIPRAGAKVRILVDALPYKKFGALEGSVASVARSTTSPDDATRELGVREPYFAVIVRLDSPNGTLAGLDLRSGMTVIGVVALEQRSLLSWLLFSA